MLAFAFVAVSPGRMTRETEVEDLQVIQEGVTHLQLVERFRKRKGLEHHILQPQCGLFFVAHSSSQSQPTQVC